MLVAFECSVIISSHCWVAACLLVVLLLVVLLLHGLTLVHSRLLLLVNRLTGYSLILLLLLVLGLQVTVNLNVVFLVMVSVSLLVVGTSCFHNDAEA